MLRLCGAELREVPAVPYKDPNNYVHCLRAAGRGAGQDASRTARSGPTSSTIPPTATATIQTTGPEIWAADRRQGRRLRLRRRHRRHAGRRRHGAEGAATRRSRSRLADPLGAALYSWYTRGELKAEGPRSPKASARGAITEESRGRAGRRRLPDPGRGGAADHLRSRAGGGPVPRRLERHQRRRRDPPGHASSGPAIRSSPSSATTAPATRSSSSIPPSCASKDLPVPDWLDG